MIVLGISGGVRAGNQDAAAALLVDGRLVAAAEEERFLGYKFANGQLPRRAVRYCLAEAGLTLADVDRVVFPGATYAGMVEILRRYFLYHFGQAPAIELVDHHTAHAASSFFASGWPQALVVTYDFSGDGKSTTVRVGHEGTLGPALEIAKPNSLGIFYSAVTQLLGFEKDSDEYKVMGMAAYGRPRFDLSHVLEVTDTGYRLHDEFLRGVRADQPASSKQERLFDQFPLEVAPRVPGTPFAQVQYDLAASAQAQLEEAVLALVRHHVSRTEIRRVCLAGGVGLNCKLNGRLRDDPFVDALYVPPMCHDAGLAVGAAYLAARAAGVRVEPLPHAYWGPSFSAGEIRETLDRTGLDYRETSDPVGAAVERLGAGEIVGWFQGRMEFGPRALGNRSILADPRSPAVKDAINGRIKFREEFRPIAPAVRHAAGPRYFSCYVDSPYMTQNFDATDAAREELAGAVHVDGTCRIQSVHGATNPLFDELLTRFAAAGGVPAVVNTSLNAYSDPLACAPHQALRTFATTGLSSLILGPFVLDKPRRGS